MTDVPIVLEMAGFWALKALQALEGFLLRSPFGLSSFLLCSLRTCCDSKAFPEQWQNFTVAAIRLGARCLVGYSLVHWWVRIGVDYII